MPDYLQYLETTIMSWDDVITAAPHRFDAREFNLHIGSRTVELGHLHSGTLLDILYTVNVRDQLIEEGKTRTHRFVPDSGWTSFSIHNQADADHALWLLRLSYLMNVARYGRGKYLASLDAEVEKLHLSDTLSQVAFPVR